MELVQFILLIIVNISIIVKSCPTKRICSMYYYKNYKDHKNVLSLLPDNYLLGQLSLVGTHQSITFSSPDIKLRKQELNITEQLNYGVRVFDISVRIETNYFGIYYQSEYLESSLNSLAYEINKFLASNPREFVILIINVDYDKEINFENIINSAYCEIMTDYVAKYSGGKRMLSKWSLDSSIYNFRGKMLLGTYDLTLASCAIWLGAKCLLTNRLKFLNNEDFSYSYSHVYDDQNDDIDYKWNKYKKFLASDALNYYPCYIYDLSINDNTHYSAGAAKYGGYDINDECVVPINYRIDNYCHGNHRPAFNIYIVDYVTQEVIDHINGLNLDHYNPFERA